MILLTLLELNHAELQKLTPDQFLEFAKLLRDGNYWAEETKPVPGVRILGHRREDERVRLVVDHKESENEQYGR